MKLTLGFSPCPNDTFIFDALVNKKIDTGSLEFEPILEDVETLNQWALEGKLDITKLSFPAYFSSLNNYVLLNAGSALGKAVGPILVKRPGIEINNIADHTILIPGINTTANLLLAFAFPEAMKKRPMLFSEIEDLLICELADLGVLIHENRFTYEKNGLEKVCDLGEIWEEKMKVPIPLGGIAIKKSIEKEIALKTNELIRKSLEFAFANSPEIPAYVKEHVQTMSEEVMRKHIDLYVNNFSLDLGEDGNAAIRALYQVFCNINQATPGEISFL